MPLMVLIHFPKSIQKCVAQRKDEGKFISQIYFHKFDRKVSTICPLCYKGLRSILFNIESKTLLPTCGQGNFHIVEAVEVKACRSVVNLDQAVKSKIRSFITNTFAPFQEG